jgi:hypothetical protein
MFYVISAYSKDHTDLENAVRHGVLLQALQDISTKGNLPKPIECIGCYNSNLEESILVCVVDEAELLDLAHNFGQESVLYVSAGHGTLIYLNDGREENIGQWREVSAEEARASGNYTFVTETDKYFVCR